MRIAHELSLALADRPELPRGLSAISLRKGTDTLLDRDIGVPLSVRLPAAISSIVSDLNQGK